MSSNHATRLLLKTLLNLKEMKTSNKLLIAFAASLILIPILCIAFVSRVYYEPGNYTSRMGETDPYGPKATNIISTPDAASAESVTIHAEGGLGLVLEIRKDSQAGVKVSDDLKGLVSIKVENNGQLHITVKGNDKNNRGFNRIAVSLPVLKELEVIGTRELSLLGEMEALKLNLTNTGLAQFNSLTKINHLNVTTTNVKDITFTENSPMSVSLNLNNTNLRSDLGSFNELIVNSSGTSNIELNGGDEHTPGKTIKSLNINTSGKTDLKVINMTINQCSGSFSDSTSVQMPAVNINQMYKAKK
jgi:hypothetical protein